MGHKWQFYLYHYDVLWMKPWEYWVHFQLSLILLVTLCVEYELLHYNFSQLIWYLNYLCHVLLYPFICNRKFIIVTVTIGSSWQSIIVPSYVNCPQDKMWFAFIYYISLNKAIWVLDAQYPMWNLSWLCNQYNYLFILVFIFNCNN